MVRPLEWKTSGVRYAVQSSANVAAPASGYANIYIRTDENLSKAWMRTSDGKTHLLSNLLFTQTETITVANTTAETSLLGVGTGGATLPANFLEASRTLLFRACGHYSTDSAAPTLTLRLRYGTVLLLSAALALPASQTNVYWNADTILVCRTAGASGTAVVNGRFEYTGSSGVLALGSAPSSTITIDTTAQTLLDVTAEWSAASASNSIACSIALLTTA